MWSGKQHPSLTDHLHACVWHKVCSSLSGHREEEQRGLQWIVNLDGVLGADLKKSQTQAGAKKEICSGLRALLDSQITPLPCAMRSSAPKPTFPTALAPVQTKEGCRAGATVQISGSLKPFCLQEQPVLCCSGIPPLPGNEFTLPWMTSPRQ